MKKHWKLIVIISGLVYSLLVLSSCATVLGGPITESQTTRPAPGEPQRKVRVGALAADLLLFWPGAVIDFATGAIYKPDPSEKPPKLTKAERTEQWEAHRADLEREREVRKAEKELKKIRKSETPEGFTFEQVQKMDSLMRIISDDSDRI